MIHVTVNGQSLEIQAGTLALDLARQVLGDDYKKALSCEINGHNLSLPTELHDGDEVRFNTWDDADGRWTLRHTASHILAQAVKHLYPEVKFAIGPAIDNGFYYDFDRDEPFTQEDLDKIEKEMKKIIKKGYRLERFELPRAEALEFMKDEPYKVELINDLPEDAVISFYKQDDFTDLCAGPHLPSTSGVKAIKLTSVTGAYWRGDSDRKMLQRIYGTAFTSKEDLEAYLTAVEEAKKRDHRKLGRELGLFMLTEEGPGFPFFLPKGMALRNTLLEYWREVHRRYGYVEISTPIILNQELWHRSGHWDHYKDNMYTTVIDEMDYAVKPMNCPGGMLVYKNQPHSYRDLPLRMAELGLVHRHELSGALHGLFRVRCFTQDDAHIFMTPEQIQPEITNVIKLFNEVYATFGLKYHAELSTRPENSLGTDESWEIATEGLRKALENNHLDYVVNEGDGAFYGPKIDFHLEDSLGRTWQCGTIQLDMLLPEKFNCEYTGEDGLKHRPIMIHRVVYGSIERFIGILIEHYAGSFPVWMAPNQVRVLPITDKQGDYAKEVYDKLFAMGYRVSLDDRSEKIGKKIRDAQVQKVPYMLVLGDKEAEMGTVAVRKRHGGDLGAMKLEDFTARLQQEIDDKVQD